MKKIGENLKFNEYLQTSLTFQCYCIWLSLHPIIHWIFNFCKFFLTVYSEEVVPEQVIQPSVKVLGESGDGLVAIEQVRVGRRRDPEADPTRYRLLRVQRL